MDVSNVNAVPSGWFGRVMKNMPNVAGRDSPGFSTNCGSADLAVTFPIPLRSSGAFWDAYRLPKLSSIAAVPVTHPRLIGSVVRLVNRTFTPTRCQRPRLLLKNDVDAFTI